MEALTRGNAKNHAKAAFDLQPSTAPEFDKSATVVALKVFACFVQLIVKADWRIDLTLIGFRLLLRASRAWEVVACIMVAVCMALWLPRTDRVSSAPGRRASRVPRECACLWMQPPLSWRLACYSSVQSDGQDGDCGPGGHGSIPSGNSTSWRFLRGSSQEAGPSSESNRNRDEDGRRKEQYPTKHGDNPEPSGSKQHGRFPCIWHCAEGFPHDSNCAKLEDYVSGLR